MATLLTGERLLPAGTPPVKLVLAGSSLVPSADNGLVALLSTGVDPMDLRKDPGEMTRNTGYAEQIRNDPFTWQGGIRLETLQALGVAAGRVSTVLPSIDVPVLLVHGAKDDMAPVSGAEQAAKVLPDARTAIFADDLHNILNELDRDDVYRTIIEFIR
ncbi:alpha-beta hydrolase superfamily lysophospholipase [Kibdelosporangium banguiense]|uniref:Alpha-beta hydrolase superfamily lysophospholipase n=1 Tax=Kibdelosporangium banguiense TaxID=1365924 RepID=A0ABS4TSH2_9PSEU|nr:alpha/beta hydrolase [Kibdelosporangium banguiense]MBP2327343.1 alpha-beta hydrolase superfamily lysophospholipase [Kibdelosporangium banguiense]